MQENNQTETVPNQTSTPTGVVPHTEIPVAGTAPQAVVNANATSTVVGISNTKKYLLAALAVVVISTGLLFVLERQGRISTGLFSSVDTSPVALVNGTEIKRSDYESSVAQLKEMAASQGASTTDPAVSTQLETQAIDTLVNGELLRQAALAAGKEAPKDAVDARYTEIETGVGGAEALAARMSDFGITNETLRRDIENEILIQALFDEVIPEVSDEQIESFYTNLGGEEAGLPPLSDVREEIKLQIQQTDVAAYIETLRADANLEILI